MVLPDNLVQRGGPQPVGQRARAIRRRGGGFVGEQVGGMAGRAHSWPERTIRGGMLRLWNIGKLSPVAGVAPGRTGSVLPDDIRNETVGMKNGNVAPPARRPKYAHPKH